MPCAEIAIETPRLLLRDYTVADAEAAMAIYADDEVMRYLGGVKHRDVSELREFLARIGAKYDAFHAAGLPYRVWAVLEKETRALVGTALLKPLPDADRVDTADIEVGWHLTRAAWGRGYATEFGRAIIAHGFDRLPVDTLHAVTDPGNERSQAVARRLGMTHRGRVVRYYGEEVEHFTISRTEWSASETACPPSIS